MQESNSEHLLPQVMATREMVLGKGSYRDAELFRNLGVCLFGEILGRGRETIWVPSSRQEEKDEIGA